jgi:hypothetical protein
LRLTFFIVLLGLAGDQGWLELEGHPGCFR